MEYKWNLDYLVKSEEEFFNGVKEADQMIAQMASFKGALGDEMKFKEYLLLQLEFMNKFYRYYQFASLSSDLNKKDIKNSTLFAHVQTVLMKLSQSLSFVNPEVLALGYDKVMSYIDSDSRLAQFKFEYQKLFRENDHVLDQASESLLANFNYMRRQGNKLYSSLAVADGVSHTVELSNRTVSVNQSNYRSLISECDNANDRKLVFEAVFKDFAFHRNTYASIYETVLQSNKAFAKVRKYDSILESYLFSNNIPTSVYHNLVDVASTYNAKVKKYNELKKQYLGIEQYHTYDRFLEFARIDKKYTFAQAKELFFAAIADYPQEFQDKAHSALEDGFVDVEIKDGKRTGAYSSSMPNMHPFILLNYNNSLDDVFTVAHEAGHSIHSMFASEYQPTNMQDYTIFVAEIASTFNEHALLDYLMKLPSTDKTEKIGLLQQSIDNILGTFYRQTLFAQYELEAHKLIEEDKPINYQVLSNIMIELYKKYYDIDITKEEVKEYVWAYVPHLFYTPFYVYQYATSFSASFKIYKDVKENVEGAFDRYLGLLKSGGSKFPIDQAKEAGVDLTTKEPYLAVVERFDYLVDELEKLLKSN